MFGSIDNPLQRLNPGGYGGISGDLGPVAFISNVFQLIALAAGLYALFNLITAGLQYISSAGDPQLIEAAQRKMNMSLLGLIIIIMSYTIAAIIGGLLFGDTGFLFSPQIHGPGTP